jgi:hypothetical protein
VNLHWFRKSNDDPFTIASTVDKTTTAAISSVCRSATPSRTDRTVAALLGHPDTEAVMQQGPTDEDQRSLDRRRRGVGSA